MSITAIGIPYLLLHALAPTIVLSIAEIDAIAREKTFAQIERMEKENINQCYTIEELEERDFETQIMDKETLLRTLNEHGAENVYEENDIITADIEGFNLNFSKKTLDTPYKLNIKFSKNTSPDILVDDISEEYNKNVQEISYNKIKERLEQKNLSINEEEILEDDTIVLTINLE